jgi:hypothetical protein
LTVSALFLIQGRSWIGDDYLYGDKTLPERLDVIGPKGQIIPNAKINLEYYISKDEFQKMLYEEKLKYVEIIERIRFPYDASTFSRLVRKLGWKTDLGKVDKYKVNEKFFDTWSRESAWFYGWLITDGHINDKSIDLRLQKRDSDVLEKLKDLIEFSGNLYRYKTTTGLRIYNRRLVESLRNLGIPKHNKTFECVYPHIPIDYEWDFIRGVFEGDGSIQTNGKFCLSLCGASYKLLSGVKEFLERNRINVRLDVKEMNGKPFYNIISCDMPSSLRWAFFMYSNTTKSIRMDRKFNKYVNFLNDFYKKQRKIPEAIELVELARKTIPECKNEYTRTKEAV